MKSNVRLGVIGVGRIGRLHAENIATRLRGATLAAVADLDLAAAREVSRRFHLRKAVADASELIADPGLDAVVICSATDTHLELIEAAAAHGKHIFCEKPIGLDIRKIQHTLAAVAKEGLKLQVGFNRRFDPSFAKARELVAAGKLGVPHLLRITSRDPAPPPLAYLRVSGGLPLDMAIHDFDMTRFLTGSEAEEIYSVGAALVDPEIGWVGDVDTCITTMRLANGVLATIDNSRQAVYGYDQRVEVFGSEGMVTVGNRTPDSHIHLDRTGVHASKPQYFFLDRYQESYIAELQEFVDCVVGDRLPSCGGHDGLMPVVMALASLKSLRERRPVLLKEFALNGEPTRSAA